MGTALKPAARADSRADAGLVCGSKVRFCRRRNEPEFVCSVEQLGCSRNAWTTLHCLTTRVFRKAQCQRVRSATLHGIGNAALVFKTVAEAC